jgi:hypothetical protein
MTKLIKLAKADLVVMTGDMFQGSDICDEGFYLPDCFEKVFGINTNIGLENDYIPYASTETKICDCAR